MKIRIGLMSYAVLAALSACNGKPPAAPPPAIAASASTGEPLPAGGKFIGRMWMLAMPGAPLGSFIIFLPNHTLLMGSCVETYRLSEWGVVDDKLRWREDIVPVEAEVTLPRPSQMELHLPGKDSAQSYVLASPPYVCPDLRK